MTIEGLAMYWLLVAPFQVLLAVYCWDYGMDLLVPVRVTE